MSLSLIQKIIGGFIVLLLALLDLVFVNYNSINQIQNNLTHT
ncbi:MAG: hypothetical protein CENE_00492 [Candidatus Celerinatantimonas neptuna]|nr:MAG: hypothetical protein CENE_00492 [Candidatus Celerinatantimonas neptuna]